VLLDCIKYRSSVLTPAASSKKYYCIGPSHVPLFRFYTTGLKNSRARKLVVSEKVCTTVVEVCVCWTGLGRTASYSLALLYTSLKTCSTCRSQSPLPVLLATRWKRPTTRSGCIVEQLRKMKSAPTSPSPSVSIVTSNDSLSERHLKKRKNYEMEFIELP